MNRRVFYDSIRGSLFGGSLSLSQVKGMEHKLNEFESKKVTDIRHQAYMLATSYHETARTMLPVEEFGKGKGYDYGKKLKRSRVSYSLPDKIFFGRGDVQLTWFENYQYMSLKLGVDLLNHPELALDPKISSDIMIEGMMSGFFTGKSLKMYFNEKVSDPVGARRIINGTDKAELIAGYYQKFYNAIKLAS